MFKSLAIKVFNGIPAQSQLILRAAQRYVDRFNGDNDSDPATNGEEQFLRIKLSKLNEGVVFDVGANVGEWTKYCLSVEPSLRMHLFEPSKPTFKKLASNSWPSNINLNCCGLGERSELLNLNIVDDASGLNSIYKRRGVKGVEMQSVEAIQIQTLDAYCEMNNIAYINLLKVDVEGHELAVFKGAQKMLSSRKVNVIQFEYGGCNLDSRVYLLDIWEYLVSFGYKFYKIYPDGPRLVKRYTQSQETFRYSNWLAVIPE